MPLTNGLWYEVWNFTASRPARPPHRSVAGQPSEPLWLTPASAMTHVRSDNSMCWHLIDEGFLHQCPASSGF